MPGIGSTVGQTIELVRAPHVRGLSALFMVLAFVNQALWTTWAFLIGDPGSVITAVTMSLLTGANLVWYGARRLGLRAFFSPTETSIARLD